MPSRKSPRYGPEFRLPEDNEECRAVYRGVENLSPRRRYGHAVPRIFTPPLGELTSETSWGFSVIDFAENVLEIELFPWQRWLLIHLLELGPNKKLRFQTAVVLIARQNGKSTLSQVLSLWFMIVRRWPLVLGTAQDLTTAEEVWSGAVDILRSNDELSTLIEREIKTNGKMALVLSDPSMLDPDAVAEKRKKIRWLVKAANRKAGRGLSGNLILMDELREQQNWSSWGAITKTTQAQDDLLIMALSNAGDITSVVLRYLRIQAHVALGDPDGIGSDVLLAASAPSDLDIDADDEDDFDDPDDMIPEGGSLFIAEWSATPGLPVKDRYGWAQANPSLGHRIRITKIANDSKTDPEWTFRTEVLCQWAEGVLDGPFPPGAWEATTNEPLELADGTKEVRLEHKIIGDLVACLDQSMDRSTVYACVAGRRADGNVQVELWASRAGDGWAKGWLVDPSVEREDGRRPDKGRIKAVTGQTRGAPVSPLMLDLKKARESGHDPFRVDVVDWQGADLMIASATMYDAVRDKLVWHNAQPPLDLAAATASMKKLQDGFVLDRNNSLADVAPLTAFCGALWLLSTYKPKRRRGSLPLDRSLIEQDNPNTAGDGGALTGGLMEVGF